MSFLHQTMASPGKFRCSKPNTLHLQINLHRRSPQPLSFPLSSRRDPTKSTPVKFPAMIRASSTPSSNPKPSLLKTTAITLTAAAALFSASYYISSRPPAISPEETRLEIESTDLKALLSLAEIKFNSKKHDEAISIMNRMIEIDPDQQEWAAIKARMLSYNGESELAIKAFEAILAKDPDRVDAYQYLVMEYFDSIPKLTELEKRINDAIRRYKKSKKKKTQEIRDLRLLIAQIKIMEGKSDEANRICEELAKDGPEDFRVYMLQGLMNKDEEEAAKTIEQCVTMIPEDHPFRRNESEPDWRIIVEYHSVFSFFLTFAKISITLWFNKSG